MPDSRRPILPRRAAIATLLLFAACRAQKLTGTVELEHGHGAQIFVEADNPLQIDITLENAGPSDVTLRDASPEHDAGNKTVLPPNSSDQRSVEGRRILYYELRSNGKASVHYRLVTDTGGSLRFGVRLLDAQ